jgi:hypothetical protein
VQFFNCISEAIMVNSTRTPSASTRRTSSPSIAASLLSELRHADAIIKAMLNALTLQQKTKVHAQLDAAGVSGEGMTRANERRAAIEAAVASLANEGATTARDAANVSEMCKLAQAIGYDARNMRILLKAAMEQLGKVPDLPQPEETVVEAVQCFTDCAMQCANLIHDEALDLLAAGGKACTR